MAWVRSEQSLQAHPKTKRAARSLEVSIPTLIGHLHCLWYWALDYAQGGNLSSFEAWEIAEAAQFEGDPERFVDALKTCGREGAGFLEDGELGLVIHDWYEYAGRYIEQRQANAERMKVARAEHVHRTCGARTGATEEESRGENEENEENEEKEEEGPPPATLLGFALRELPASESTPADYERTLTRHQARLPRSQIERIVCELAEWKPAKPRDKLHLTLNKWLAKEEPGGGGNGRPATYQPGGLVRTGRSENGEW